MASVPQRLHAVNLPILTVREEGDGKSCSDANLASQHRDQIPDNAPLQGRCPLTQHYVHEHIEQRAIPGIAHRKVLGVGREEKTTTSES